MSDSRAVALWPSAKVRDSGLEEASPVGCPSTFWSLVGGQVGRVPPGQAGPALRLLSAQTSLASRAWDSAFFLLSRNT